MKEKFGFLKAITLFDIIIFAFILLAASGVLLVKTGKINNTPDIVQAKKEVEFDVLLRAEKYSGSNPLFVPGEYSFITIRNVPYTKLEITGVHVSPWKTVVQDKKNLSKVIAVEDPSTPYTYNFLITLKDDALITPDGAVIGGNKIKIGLPVQLEGEKYKFSGVVSDIRVQS